MKLFKAAREGLYKLNKAYASPITKPHVLGSKSFAIFIAS